MVLLVVLLEYLGCELRLLGSVYLCHNLVESHRAVVGAYVGAACGEGYLFEGLLVELRHHHLALLVAYELLTDAYGCALGCADADGVYLDAACGGCLGRGECILLVVLAIGDEHHHATTLALRGEGAGCQVDSGGYVGALLAHRGGRYLRYEVARGDVVARDGELHVGVAREDDDTNLVLLYPLQQTTHSILGALQAVGLEVLGEHRVAHVDSQHYLDALALHLAELGAYLRTGQADDQEREADDEEGRLEAAATWRVVGHQRLQGLGVAEVLQATTTLATCPQVEPYEQRHKQQKVQKLYILKSKHFFTFGRLEM